jgi:hypothetical protein
MVLSHSFISFRAVRRIKGLGGSAEKSASRTTVRAEHFASATRLGGYTLKNLDWKMVATVAGAAVAGFSLIAYAFFRPTVDPEEVERKRRLHLNQIGRIAEGQVVDLAEHEADPRPAQRGLFGSKPQPLAVNRLRHLVSYSYAISGVTYQTAQDITGLESQVRMERLVAGQPASIKYDPSNPVDSILVADDWSGLR